MSKQAVYKTDDEIFEEIQLRVAYQEQSGLNPLDVPDDHVDMGYKNTQSEENGSGCNSFVGGLCGVSAFVVRTHQRRPPIPHPTPRRRCTELSVLVQHVF